MPILEKYMVYGHPALLSKLWCTPLKPLWALDNPEKKENQSAAKKSLRSNYTWQSVGTFGREENQEFFPKSIPPKTSVHDIFTLGELMDGCVKKMVTATLATTWYQVPDLPSFITHHPILSPPRQLLPKNCAHSFINLNKFWQGISLPQFFIIFFEKNWIMKLRDFLVLDCQPKPWKPFSRSLPTLQLSPFKEATDS